MIRRRIGAVAVVLAVTAAVLPAQPDGVPAALYPWDSCEVVDDDVYVSCLIIYTDGEGPPAPAGPTRVPVPTRPATNGVPGCVRGPQRPVVDTVTPKFSVVFTDPDGSPIDATFEFQPLDGSEEPTLSGTTAYPGKTAVREEREPGLGPGESYRWRVTGASSEEGTEGWSEWCEFTVAAGLVDMRNATDIYAVKELGVVPDRTYPVTLTVRQWRLAVESMAPDDEGAGAAQGWIDEEPDGEVVRLERNAADIQERINGRAAGERVTVTLTGDEWASAATAVVERAVSWDMLYEEEPEVGDNGRVYWKVVDRISAELGGPPHPGLGAER